MSRVITRSFLLLACAVVLASLPRTAQGQMKQSEGDFIKAKPTLGDALPDLTVYDPDGKELKTSSLRGHYTVLTFGCLT